MLTLQKLWAVQWAWPIVAYVLILYSEIRTNLSYGHPLIPRRPDKRGFTVILNAALAVLSDKGQCVCVCVGGGGGGA